MFYLFIKKGKNKPLYTERKGMPTVHIDTQACMCMYSRAPLKPLVYFKLTISAEICLFINEKVTHSRRGCLTRSVDNARFLSVAPVFFSARKT